MSLKIVLLISAGAGLLGILIGYYLRLIISLGKRGSMELEIKQMMIVAKRRPIKSPTRRTRKLPFKQNSLNWKKKEGVGVKAHRRASD